jgi:superfamily II DNA/RNA helicase
MPSFAALGLPAPLLRALAANGFTDPFPIQAATLPDALAGRDLLGRGQTGSGKTLAFGLAVLARLAGERSRPRRPRGLVLVPTRELATQVLDALVRSPRRSGLSAAAVVGGMSFNRQSSELQRGVDVLVATPGRLADHLDQGTCASATSRSPRSTRPTGWRTWASCRRSGASSTRRRPTVSGCCSPPPSTATSARSSCATSPIR